METKHTLAKPDRERLALMAGANSHVTLEQLLFTLATFGKPRVSMQSSGWHACVDMHVSAAGVSFEVKSDFGHKAPSDAARQCAERVLAALNGLA